MKSQEKFSLLRSILKALGLSPEAIDDIIERVVDFLSELGRSPAEKLEFPYHIRDDFLSQAEQSFYLVLKNTIAERALICPKVGLGDLLYVKSSDPSKFRTYTNKIDRKHVDFLLCDPMTVKPLFGIELDDKSHQARDRQERDQFVEKVFEAAGLPLVRIKVQRAYSTKELESILGPHLGFDQAAPQQLSDEIDNRDSAPRCPKCGNEMVLRIAKSGTNQGNQFWGCPDYPRCRGIVNIDPLN